MTPGAFLAAKRGERGLSLEGDLQPARDTAAIAVPFVAHLIQ